jgi:Flp pilus assembly protein TadD
MAHLRLNQLEETITDSNKAIQFKPEYFDALFQRGLSFLDNGEFYKAREDADRLIKFSDTNWKSHFLYGLSQEKLKNFPAALEAFSKAAQLEPGNSDLLVNQATILYYQKQYGSAEEILSKAETINPAEPNLHNLRSMILFDQKDYPGALASVEKAIALDNRQAYFYNNQGLYLLFLGEPEKAVELINQSIQMDPKNPFALRNKGIYYVMKGDKISALEYLQELAKNYPEMDLVQEYFQKAQDL